MKRPDLEEIELTELKYLKKYYYFLKFAEDELLAGLKTKEAIKSDWYGIYKSGISDFSVGAERIVYSLLNGKGIGQPNSAPVGADLFFEVKDAFIHIDLKTVGTTLNPRKENKKTKTTAWSDNIGDFFPSIVVGTNQNSYKSEIKQIRGGDSFYPGRFYAPTLPTFYNRGSNNEKVCLTYFVAILFDRDSLDILVICILCMPNGELYTQYRSRVLQAGKNIEETRFRYKEVPKFELISDKPNRVRIVYRNDKMDIKYKNKLASFEKLFCAG